MSRFFYLQLNIGCAIANNAVAFNGEFADQTSFYSRKRRLSADSPLFVYGCGGVAWLIAG